MSVAFQVPDYSVLCVTSQSLHKCIWYLFIHFNLDPLSCNTSKPVAFSCYNARNNIKKKNQALSLSGLSPNDSSLEDA